MATFEEILANPELKRDYLVQVQGWDPVAAAEVMSYFSSSDFTKGVFSGVFWKSRLKTPIEFTASLGSMIEPRGVISSGRVEIVVSDGDLDALFGYYFEGRPITVYMGDSSFGEVADGTVAAVSWDANILRFVLRDSRFILDRPIQTSFYAGTGGVEGGADLKNRLKPLAFGMVRNAEPIITDQTNLVMQVHERSIYSFAAVYDRGVLLTIDGADSADYAELLAWTPVAGKYKAYKGLGMIRLGSAPVGPVTVDFLGDNTGGYVDTAGTIIQRIVAWKAGSVPPVDTTAFSTVETARPWVCGLYFRDGGSTMNEAVDRLAGSIGAWTDISAIGDLTIGILAFGTSVMTIDEMDYSGLQAIATPSPPSKVTIGYQRSCLVQEIGDLAAAATAARKAFVSVPYRYESATGVTLTQYPAAAEYTRNTALDVLANASTLATSIKDLVSAGKRQWTLAVVRVQHKLKRGDIITIKHPQYFAAGRDFIIQTISETVGDSERITRLQVYG